MKATSPAALLLLPALLAGCERGTPNRAPRTGGTAVIAGYVDLRTMNPLYTLPDVNKALERHALAPPAREARDRIIRPIGQTGAVGPAPHSRGGRRPGGPRVASPLARVQRLHRPAGLRRSAGPRLGSR